MNDRLSVYTAEIIAIISGLQWPERLVICSNSIAALNGINSKETIRDDLLLEISVLSLRTQRIRIYTVLLGSC